jgi:hypothetical protein
MAHKLRGGPVVSSNDAESGGGGAPIGEKPHAGLAPDSTNCSDRPRKVRPKLRIGINGPLSLLARADDVIE